jgi:hypothetical protein
MNFPGTSIAASPMDASTVEATVKAILDRRQECVLSPSDDILRRIQTIRSICKATEATEGNGQVNWRRNGSSSGKPNSNHARWRQSGPTAASSSTHSFPPKQKSSTTQHNERGSGRYVSKFKNTDLPVEDTILNKVILNKLNKFSLESYDSIKQFLKQILDSDETEFLHSFMLLVFKKAAVEPTFCPLYARLVSELSADYPSFKKELNELYVKYLSIFEEISEEQTTSYEQYVQRNREKIHRLGYSQFLAELTGYGILELEQLKTLYIIIIEELKKHSVAGKEKQQLIEEYVECLVRMTKAFQKETNTDTLYTVCRQLGNTCEPLLEDILTNRTKQYPGLTMKVSFRLMDCVDIFRSIPN